MSFSFSLDQQLLTSYQGMFSHGERHEHKRTNPTIQVHFKPLIVSGLWISCWVKQSTWPSPKPKGRYIKHLLLQGHSKGVDV